MQSIWVCVHPSGECHVVLLVLLYNLCPKNAVTAVSWCLKRLANSTSFNPLSLVSPIPNFPTVPFQPACEPGSITSTKIKN